MKAKIAVKVGKMECNWNKGEKTIGSRKAYRIVYSVCMLAELMFIRPERSEFVGRL